MTKLEQFKQVCHKYLIIHDDTYIDVIFGIIYGNRLDSKPICLYLVGPPSSGKTEVLQALSSSPNEIYPISKFKASAFISGKILGAREKDPSILAKLNNKVLVIKDFTAMLNMRYDALMEVIGLMRDSLDGSARQGFGTGNDKVYEIKYGCIAAVTNVIDRHRGILADLGERFLTYRMPDITKKEQTRRCQKASRNLRVSEKEKALKTAAAAVLTGNKQSRATLSDQHRHNLIKIAAFVATARCHVARDRKTREPEIPMPEVATRLSKQLCDLAIGVAMAREKRVVTKAEIRLVQKTAIDSLSLKRIHLIHAMLHTHPKWSKTAPLAAELKFSVSIVSQWLEDLYLLGIVDKDSVKGTVKDAFVWRLCEGTMLKQILEYL